MFEFTKKINEVIESCLENGRSNGVELMDSRKTIISAEWESWGTDERYDTVTVYIMQNGCLACSFQVEETKVLDEEE